MTHGTATNLKIFATVLVTLGVYTWVANAIPQVASEVPEELTLGPDVSAEELVTAGEELFGGAGGCTACHGLGTRAPNVRTDHQGEGPIGARCGDRVEGQSCKEYLYESMVEPAAYLVEGFGPIMPPQDRILTNNQIWALIAYLESLGGEVTVTAADIQATAGGGGGPPAQAGGGGGEDGGGGSDPIALMQNNLCFNCHVLGDRGVALGPSLDEIGARRSAEYIRNSIVNPGSEAAEGYENLLGTMPPNLADMLGEEGLDTVVRFLSQQTGDGS